MSTATATPALADAAAREADGPRGPFGRIAAASIVGALAIAVVPTLVRTPSEGVVTGTALVGFAVGWAMIALLTTRFTDRPQRWALVPAALMWLTGAALLVTDPGDTALRAAGWIWPPALLALGVWTAVRMRRDMPRRARWLLYPVVAVLGLCAVGGAVETVSLAHDGRTLAQPGQRYDVNGRSMHMQCLGAGAPTVVLEAGLGEMSANWARVMPAVARTSRVCAYDRAGQGWSDPARGTRDSAAVVADLRALLAAAGEHGPYVFTGHSVGGVYAMTYAARYPADVAGLVLLDSSTPRQFTVLPEFPQTYAMARRLYAVLPSLARVGVGRLIPASAMSDLPEPSAGRVRTLSTTSLAYRTTRDEHSALRAAFAQGAALTSFGGKPLAVVTATRGAQPGWTAAQEQLAALSTHSRHVLASTTHVGLLDEATYSQVAAHAIADVVAAVRAAT